MNKKRAFLICLSLMLLCLTSCIPKGYKEVDFCKLGIMYIPEKWHFIDKGNIIYFTDKPMDSEDYKIYLKGFRFYPDDNSEIDFENNKDLEDLWNQTTDETHDTWVCDEGFSNSTTYSEDKVVLNGKKQIVKSINVGLYDDVEYEIYAMTDVSEETMKTIAKSFNGYDE